jgi:chromosomal replication initiator protein
MDKETLWKSALAHIELSISKANFVTWFKNTSIFEYAGNEVSIVVPNGFAKEWLENKYNHYILQALQSVDPAVSRIRCVINPTPTSAPKLDSVHIAPSHQAPTQNNFQNNSSPETKKTIDFTRKKIIEQPNFRQNTTQEVTPVFHQTNLNTRYDFENFIVAENNELARAACMAVAENLGGAYNPLFIYGGVGLGKTHLLQSIGNSVAKKHPEKRIKYISSEKFTRELVESIKNQKIDQFKDYYEQMDLLIIDDIQFLSGREKTQNEFFQIFNTLYQINKQIVISSDRPPKAIPTLEERLRSRFEGGMITDISRPSLETRLAILESKVLERGLLIDKDALFYIADNVSQNIRELEGALNRVVAYSEFQKIPANLENTKKILDQLLESNKKTVSIDDVFSHICDRFQVSREDLIKKGRKKEVVYPRQIMMYLLRTELQNSFSSIGEVFNGRDHTTVLHAVEKIEREKEINDRVKGDILHLKEVLYYTPPE